MVTSIVLPVNSSAPESSTMSRPNGRPKAPRTIFCSPGSAAARPGHAPPTVSASKAPKEMNAPARHPSSSVFHSGAVAFASPRLTALQYVAGGGEHSGPAGAGAAAGAPAGRPWASGATAGGAPAAATTRRPPVVLGAFSVAPNSRMRISLSLGSRDSSSAGMPFSKSFASSGFWPIFPPSMILTPSTALPSFLAGAPIRPMSPTWACPHELGHPVQCMRTCLGMSSWASSFSHTAIARCFVSIKASPQNCEPVQLTRPPVSWPGVVLNLWKKGEACIASALSVGTEVNTTFCSHVRRSSPSPNSRAARAACAKS
mmetsp:Transcript_1556/g.4231  ORF Transcript_1556/g.4231 Transcript_1556/m.4231 type:complete len:315 (-) Transcript_1556:1082-2026(-)